MAKSGEDVHVDVDEPGREIEAGDINRFFAGTGGNRWLDGGDLAIANGYITFRVDVVFRVDDLAIA